MKKTTARVFAFLCCVALCVTLFGCGAPVGFTVTWFDADGAVLGSEQVSADFDPTEQPLPEDTDVWHYTGWTLSRSGEVVVCTAIRTVKTKVVWKDYDGTVLEESFIIEDETVEERDLPEPQEGWIYTDWSESTGHNEISYVANRTPDTSYFCGNVFQIVVKDQTGEPYCVGSGFVVNDEGWFITNNHVMENGYSASAYFDIKDEANGNKYTTLDILGGVYNDATKDIFIGKLANYEKIKDHYKEIKFTEEYAEGDTCYSVGYPDSSITLEINKGTVLEEYSNIRDKINGVYYLLSDCYIAPGSSGGILISEQFEVIGITSMGLYTDETHRELISGGSIPTLAFKEQLKNLNEADIRSLVEIYGIEI